MLDSFFETAMLRDGIYKLSYGDVHSGFHDTALAVVRSGVILASDPYGGVYKSLVLTPAPGGRIELTMRCVIPPDGELVTGQSGGPEGREIMASAIIDGTADEQSVTADMGGVPLPLTITYLGPLPTSG